MDKRTTMTEDQLKYIFECRKDGITKAAIADSLGYTEGALSKYISTVEDWIYMLKDKMSPEEALEDWCTNLKNPTRIMWGNNPEWCKTVLDNFDLPIREIAYILFTTHGIKASKSSLVSLRYRRYKDRTKDVNNGPQREWNITISPDLYIKPGFIVKHCEQEVPVICYAQGHETMKWIGNGMVGYDGTSGCNMCRNEAPKFRHHNPLEAGIFYWGDLIDSNLNDFKLGRTLERIGVDKRAKNYGTFDYEEVHKPICEVEEFEQYMKLRYEKYSTHNPMLKDNGSSECFDKIVLPDLKWFINIWTIKGLPKVKTRLDMALKI